jgi:hypothetical protein
MNKLTLSIGVLTIAAALNIAFTSCSSSGDDDPMEPTVEEPTKPAPQTIQITVGAGIDNGTLTRSMVDGTTKRTLKFTAGDRLYVTGTVAEGQILAGFLEIDETSFSGGTSATFTGTYTSTNGVEFSKATGLHVYQYNTTSKNYLTVSHSFTNTTNPLCECELVSALLVHNGTTNNLEVDTKLRYAQLMPVYNNFLASTVNELMTQCLYISGSYSADKFLLAVAEDGYCSPIFNCDINGLAASTTYQVEHIFGTENWTTSVGKVTTDGSGKATFAYYIPNMISDNNYSHTIHFESTTGNKYYAVNLGQKQLEGKVYKVKTTAATATSWIPTITGTTKSPNEKGGYVFEGEDDAEFSLSGTSIGYYFRLKKAATIFLDDFNATYNVLNGGLWGFFDCNDNLTLYIRGNNSITCRNMDQCIYVYGDITLKGTSGSTLTVTCKSNSSSEGIQVDGGKKTLDGVSVSGPDNHNDGTSTWTYTVTKTNL